VSILSQDFESTTTLVFKELELMSAYLFHFILILSPSTTKEPFPSLDHILPHIIAYMELHYRIESSWVLIFDIALGDTYIALVIYHYVIFFRVIVKNLEVCEEIVKFLRVYEGFSVSIDT
jgi:hypothetical protein